MISGLLSALIAALAVGGICCFINRCRMIIRMVGGLNVPLTHDHHDMLMTSMISEAPHLHGQSALRCHPRMLAQRDDRFSTIFAVIIVIFVSRQGEGLVIVET